MRLTHVLRAGAAALALMGAATVDRPVLAQSGETAGDATGLARAMSTGTMNSLFPQTVASMPLPMPQGGGGGIGGFADRVKEQSTNIPDRYGKTLINVGTPYVNAIFGGIHEGAGLAGGIELTTADKLGKQFEIYGDALVSTRLYRRFEVGALIGKEADRAEIRYAYTRRPKDNFFGLGPFSDEDPLESPAIAPFLGGETNYDREVRAFTAGYSHYFDENKLAIGGYFDVTSNSIYEGDDDADPSIFSVYLPYHGLEESFPTSPVIYSSQLPGLENGAKILTYGLYAEADYRTNDHGLTQGFYGYLRYAGHDGLDDDIATLRGTTHFGWNQLSADLRGYLPLFSDKNSLALRFWTDLNSRRGDDVIPFFYLARLGGNATNLRGFDTFRFYGEKAILFQGEYRRELFTFGEDRAVDLNLFGDAGQVWGLGYEPVAPVAFDFDQFDSYDYDNYEADLGLGVTARIGKKFALRIDYAHSNEADKVRLSFNRGF